MGIMIVYLCLLLQVGQHDNGGDTVVPHHPPEVT